MSDNEQHLGLTVRNLHVVCSWTILILCLSSAFFLLSETAIAANRPAAAPAISHPGADEVRTSAELEKALEVRGVWSSTGSSLAEELVEFRALTGIMIIRDRRVDPGSPCEYEPAEGKRTIALSAISRTQDGLGWQPLGPVIYLGPKTSAIRLSLLTELLDEQLKASRTTIPSDVGARLRRRTSLKWDDLTSPREILEQLCTAAQVRLENAEDIPHDLWARSELPPLSFIEATVLILNQFDLTLSPAGGDRFRVGPPDETFSWDASYAIGKSQQSAIEEQLQREGLSPELRWSTSRVTVVGSLPDHLWWMDRVQQDSEKAGQGTSGNSPAGLRQRLFTLRVERATMGALIAEFRRQGIRIEIANETSAEVQQALKQPIEVDASQKKADEFFRSVFGDRFAKVEVTDDSVRLSDPRQ